MGPDSTHLRMSKLTFSARLPLAENKIVFLASDPALARNIAAETPRLAAAAKPSCRNLGTDFQLRPGRRCRPVLNDRLKTARKKARRLLRLKQGCAKAAGIVNTNLRPTVTYAIDVAGLSTYQNQTVRSIYHTGLGTGKSADPSRWV